MNASSSDVRRDVVQTLQQFGVELAGGDVVVGQHESQEVDVGAHTE